MNRKIAVVAAGLAAMLALASCAQGSKGGSSDDVEYSSTAAMQPATLTMMGFNYADADEIGTTRYDLATEAIKPATITPSDGELDTQAFLAAVNAGNAPDLVYVKRDQLGTFAARGVLEPLESCLSGEGVVESDFNKAAVSQSNFNGKQYGWPEFNQVQMTFANPDLLAAAGLSIKDVNGTNWDAMTAANAKMTVKDGSSLSVIGYDPKLPEFLPLWAKANDAELLSADGKKAQLNDPKVVEALEFAVSFYTDNGGFPVVKSTRDSSDFWGEGNQYATNVLGAMNMEQWYMNVLSGVTPDAPIEFSPFYSKTTGDPIAYATGSAWAITSASENKAQACRFIRVMTEVDSWMAAAQARVDLRQEEGKAFTGLLTANDTADAKIRDMVTSSGMESWDGGVEAMYTANDHLFYLPANPADAEFKTAWQSAVTRVLEGTQSAQDAMDQAQTEAQKALDDAWAAMESK